MAKKTTPPSEPKKTSLLKTRSEAYAQIKEQIEKLKKLLAESNIEQARTTLDKYADYNKELLGQMFDNDAIPREYRGAINNARNIQHAGYTWDRDAEPEIGKFHQAVQEHINVLESIYQRLELIPESPRISASEERSMTDNGTVRVLEEKLGDIAILRGLQYDSSEFNQWRRDVKVALTKIFAGDNGSHAGEFDQILFSLTVARATGNEQQLQQGYQNVLSRAETMLKSMIQEIKQWNLPKGNASDTNAFSLLLPIFKKFHRLDRQMRKRHNNRPTLEIEDEYDVQDFLHVLLKLYFDDIRPEEWTPSYAGSSSKMDFLLKKEQTVIETKKTRKGLTDREVGEQLIVDIQKYRVHPDCKSLICFVYDPEGKIANPKALENDLSNNENDLKVTVIVEPK